MYIEPFSFIKASPSLRLTGENKRRTILVGSGPFICFKINPFIIAFTSNATFWFGDLEKQTVTKSVLSGPYTVFYLKTTKLRGVTALSQNISSSSFLLFFNGNMWPLITHVNVQFGPWNLVYENMRPPCFLYSNKHHLAPPSVSGRWLS